MISGFCNDVNEISALLGILRGTESQRVQTSTSPLQPLTAVSWLMQLIVGLSV